MTAVVRLRLHKRLNPSQARAWHSDARWTAFLGGWGAGKTWLGARAFLRNVLENPARVDALLVGPYWSTVNRTTLREFRGVVPKQLVTTESKKERFIEVLGRRVYYGSADEPQTLDGPTVGAVWIDEGRYVSREGWRIILTRLRSKAARKLRGIITSTPGGEWLQEEFDTGKADRVAIHASTRENARNLGDGTVEDMERSLSRRAAQVYIEGQFGLLEGAVYDFDPAWHCIPWTYRSGLRTVAAWDFGYQMPAVVFLQQVPAGTHLPPVPGFGLPRIALPGTWIAFDELVPENISTEQLAQQVRAKGYRLDTVYCDPAGDAAQIAYGISDVQVLRAAGWNVRFVTEPRLRHIPYGVRVVDALLRNVAGETRLYVSASLKKPGATRGVVKDLALYHYPERKDGRPVSDHPVKDGVHDHVCDAVRYWAVNEVVSSGGGFEGSIPAL